MEIFCLHVAQAVDGERGGLGKYALCAVVLVFAVFVLKVDGMFAGKHFHSYAFCADIVDGFHFRLGQRGDQQEVGRAEAADAVGKVEGGAAGHVDGVARGYDFIKGNMSYATDFRFLRHFVLCFFRF